MNIFDSSFKNLGRGFGLVETLVAVAIFVLISVSVYGGFVRIMEGNNILKIKNLATSLANEKIEIVRNLPYEDVGIVNGLPLGKLLREETINRDGINFFITTSVRDIDDPFDGQIGEEPNDLSPADYKLVEFSVSCSDCPYEEELKYYARVSALSLETQGNNGALFVRVFDSGGQPVEGADVHIENNKLENVVNIDETTNVSGMFQIVNAPTSTEGYEVSVTKEDYSIDKTYPIGDPENPIPDRPHANVASGQVTQLSFYIDKLSDLEISTKKTNCSAVSDVDFNIRGSKTIGYQVYKYDVNHVTNSSGFKGINDIEWDSYNFNIIDSAWDLIGSSPVLPVDISPNTTQVIDLILTNKKPAALQVSVKDSGTGLPVSDASVVLSSGSTDFLLLTGRGFLTQTDWSGGSNQEYFADGENRFWSSNGNVEYQDSVGDIKLVKFNDYYLDNGILESAIFDIGTTTNFGHIFWKPTEQATSTGSNSVRLQIATNVEITASTTWNFVGPDGTVGTYYTDYGQEINNMHDGDRYLKYKVYLSTINPDYTPIISNISFTVMTGCTPPGQVLFNDLDLGQYSLEISHPDYQDYFLDSISIQNDWQTQTIILTPN